MEEFSIILGKLAGASFATLLAAILFANWRGIWMWTRDHEKIIQRHEELMAHEIKEKEYWRDTAERLMSLAEVQVLIAKRQLEKP